MTKEKAIEKELFKELKEIDVAVRKRKKAVKELTIEEKELLKELNDLVPEAPEPKVKDEDLVEKVDLSKIDKNNLTREQKGTIELKKESIIHTGMFRAEVKKELERRGVKLNK